MLDKMKKALGMKTEKVKKLTPEEERRAILEKEKAQATKDKKPWVAVLDTQVNPDDIKNGFFELDWNNEFIEQLMDAGYSGEKPEDIVEAVFFGVEMFDCVLPTRNARNGQLITSTGVINIRNAKYRNDDSPIDENSDSKVCKNYSKAYLHHLDKTNEMLGSMLASYHNIYYYHELMKQIRQSIDDDIFVNFAKDFYNNRNLPIPDYMEG